MAALFAFVTATKQHSSLLVGIANDAAMYAEVAVCVVSDPFDPTRSAGMTSTSTGSSMRLEDPPAHVHRNANEP